tara:strand:- start:766 stop:1050 length:285 start_codon:yes stop_codon:yes gene_type:complete
MMSKKDKSYYEYDRNLPINNLEKENKTPDYYIGNEGLEAIDVVHQFNLSYDLGNACSYILRSKNKHDDDGYECIQKAIRHLQYELRKIKKKRTH